MDQYGIAQRRVQSLTAELEEIRGNLDAVSIALSLAKHDFITFNYTYVFLYPLGA